MTPLLLFLAVVSGLYIRKLTPEERIQHYQKALEMIQRAGGAGRRLMTNTADGGDEFYTALRERTRWPLVTATILFLYVALYVLMFVRGSSLEGEELLLHWGGSVGPRTTNGEWWRLVTAMFIHWGFLHLIADAAGISQIGRLTERLVGSTTFAFVFVAAGLIGGLRELSAHPVAVNAGASGGVFGIYGLLLATGAWGWVKRSPLTIPVGVLKRMAPGAAIFLLYHLVAEGVTASMAWGLVVGLVCGGVLAFGIEVDKPPVRRLYPSMAATLAIIVLFAAPLRGMADVTRELRGVITLEERTATSYDAEVVRFRKGWTKAEQLADMAEAIASDVRATRASLSTITNVPPAHQPVVKSALEFLRLREESWTLRVEGLRNGSLKTLQRADRAESQAKMLFTEVEKLKSGEVEK